VKIIPVILLFLIISTNADSTETDFGRVVFDLSRVSYHALAFGDYWTTHHASFNQRYIELNKLTRLYWRSEPVYCFFKAAETVLWDSVYRFIYKHSKILGILTVVVCGVIRYMAFKSNLRVLGGQR
jgi:hypothetical protein